MKYKVQVTSKFLDENFGIHTIEIKSQALLKGDTLTVIEKIKPKGKNKGEN